MRSYSFFAVLLLCIAIVSIDAVTFYWLQYIIKWIPSATTQLFINILFWIFTIVLVSAILVFKIRIGKVPVTRRQPIISYLYGFTISSFIQDRKSTRLNSSHVAISYAVFCLKK